MGQSPQTLRHSVGRWRHGDTRDTGAPGDKETQGIWRQETGDMETGDTETLGDTRRHGDTHIRERGDTAGGHQPGCCTLASCLPDLSR